MQKKYCNRCLGEELALSAASISTIIAKNLNLSDIELLSAFLTSVGDSLAIIATHRSIYESVCIDQSSTNNNSNNIKNINPELNVL